MKPTLKNIRKIICKYCDLEGHCADDVKCDQIEELEKLFKTVFK